MKSSPRILVILVYIFSMAFSRSEVNLHDGTVHKGKLISFDEEYSYDFSGNRVICRSFIGGHSNCDIVIFIPDLNLAYLGDIYLSESFPLIGISVDAKAQKLVSSLKEIHEMLPEDTRLFAGCPRRLDRKTTLARQGPGGSRRGPCDRCRAQGG